MFLLIDFISFVLQPENARFNLSLKQDGDAFRLEQSIYTSSARVDVRVDNSGYLDFEVRQNLTFQVCKALISISLSYGIFVLYVGSSDRNTSQKLSYI